MALAAVKRVVIAFSLFHLPVIFAQNRTSILGPKISENDIEITPLKPVGIRVTVKHKPGMHLVIFQGNVNRKIEKDAVGSIHGESSRNYCGKWTIYDQKVAFEVGDTINYFIFVSQGGRGYILDQLSYKVTEFKDKALFKEEFRCDTKEPATPSTETNTETTVANGSCKPSVTRVRGSKDPLCSGDAIFTDTFDNRVNDEVWQIEQYIPLEEPEYPFMSYQMRGTVAAGHNLVISPKLQQKLVGFSNDSIYTGTLNLLNGCTKNAEVCTKQAFGANILPPVASAKLTSKNFAFIYGNVEIRAKLPKGDWIYPELHLEPVQYKYGMSQYASGLLKIASARGNAELYEGTIEYGNSLLYGGPVLDSNCPDALLGSKFNVDSQGWGDGFHVYSMRWAPDKISFAVDGEQWWEVSPGPGGTGLRGRMPDACNRMSNIRINNRRSKIAPFDDYFQIALGVGVGGVVDFPDDTLTTSGRPKPWKNRSSKAMLHFWQDLEAWFSSWQEPRLLVDYVKVTAL